MTIVRHAMRWLRGYSPSAGWRRGRVLGLGIVLLILAVEGFALRDPYEPAPRDIDASVKRAQTLALGESGFLRQALPYRARHLDPQQWYLPFVKPFVMRTRTGMQSIFPTAAAAIDVPAEWLGGMAALRLVSLVAALAAVLLVLRGLRDAQDVVAPVAIVLATPLWYYALGGTSHPVGLLLAMGALTAAIDGERAFTSGLLLGLSSALRDEALALAPGLLVIGALRWRSPGPLARMVTGIAVPIGLMALADQYLYGRPAAAHLLHAVQGSFFADLPTGSMVVLEPMSWRKRIDTVLVYWIDGRSLTHAAVVSGGLAFAAVVRHLTGSFWGAMPALGIVLVDAATDVVALLEAPKRLPGLLRLAPFLLFAVLPHAEASSDQKRRRTSVLILSAVFVLVAATTTNTSGGKPLGPRLLLPIWLPLSVVAWQGVRGHVLAGGRALAHRLLAAGGVALVLAGLAINVVMLMPVYRVAEADALEATRFLARSADEVVVMGSPFAIDPVIAVYPSKSVMLASSAEDVRDIAERLERGRIRQFRFVRRSGRDDLVAEFPSYGMTDESVFGRWIIQRWTLR